MRVDVRTIKPLPLRFGHYVKLNLYNIFFFLEYVVVPDSLILDETVVAKKGPDNFTEKLEESDDRQQKKLKVSETKYGETSCTDGEKPAND